MLSRRSLALIVVLAGCLAAGQVWAEVFAYPKKGQSQEQFENDQFQCHKWAKAQTGFDPAQAQPQAVTSAPQQGGAVRGAAGGAAVGAIGGAIGGDAGKGAAIGAGVGGALGLLKQSARNQQAAQAQAQAQAARSSYDRAYATCLEGRGYQVH